MPLEPLEGPDKFDELLVEAGGQFRSGSAPDKVTIDWLKIQCGKLERTLRNQYEDRDLPSKWEAELAKLPTSDMTGALRRWAYLKHLYRVWNEGLKEPGTRAEGDELLAAYQLLRREPVQVSIGTRTVEVTERSLACLMEIGRHAARIEWLLARLQKASDLGVRLAVEAKLDVRAQRRLLWVKDEQQALMHELNLQRKALYAHVFTENGAPAESLDEVPAWWDEVTPMADAMLVQAVNSVGAGRAAKLGEQPKPPPRPGEKGRMEYLEDFGWLSTLARWGVTVPVREADFLTRPLGQAMALFRLGAEAVYVENG